MRLIKRICLAGIVVAITAAVAQRAVSADEPLVNVSIDRHVLLNRPDQQLAYWKFESPDLLGEETHQYRLTAEAPWGETVALNPRAGNRWALNTRQPDNGTFYVCRGRNPLDAIGADSFVVEGFGNGGNWGGHDRVALDCRTESGVGILVVTKDRGTRYEATVQLSDGSQLTATSQHMGPGNHWSYFAVVRDRGRLRFYVRNMETRMPLTLVELATGSKDQATVTTDGADWKLGGGPWYPSFDQYRVTRILSDRMFALLTGDRIDIKGIRRTRATLTARLNSDAGNLPKPVALVFEMATEGGEWQHVTTVEPETLKLPIHHELLGLPAGTHRVRLRLMSAGQEVARSQTREFVRIDADPDPARISFSTAGTLRINGQRSLPIGLITRKLDQAVIHDLKAHGYSLVLTDCQSDETSSIQQDWELLNACQQAGLAVVLSLRDRKSEDDGITIRTWRGHPAVAGWNLHNTDRQQNRQSGWATWRQIKPLVPDQFLTATSPGYTTPRSSLSSVLFAGAAASRSKDAPLEKNAVRALAMRVRALRSPQTRPLAPYGARPVWAVLSGTVASQGRPLSAAELKAQVFAAIVAGAQGILVLDDKQTRQSEAFSQLGGPFEQLRQLTPVITDPNSVRRAHTTDSIETWVKRHNGYDYVIAVNTSQETLQSTLALPNARALGRIEVLFEDRLVKPMGDRFTDQFEPFGVHVYKVLADTAARSTARLYPVYPFGPMNRTEPGLPLPDSGPQVTLARGELESVCVVVDNRGEKADTFDFLVKHSGLPAGSTRVARTAYVPARDHGGPHAAGDEVADALIDTTSFTPVTIAAGECRHIWVTLNGNRLEPGNYNLNVTLVPMTARRDRRERNRISTRVSIHVHDFELPRKIPLHVYSWDQSMPLTNQDWFDNFVEHRMNVFSVRMDTHAKNARVRLQPDGRLEKQPDFSDLTEMLLRGKPHGKFYIESGGLGNGDIPCTNGGQIKRFSEPWKIGYKQWIVAFCDYLEGLGIGTDQWFFCPFDESFFNGGEETTFIQAKLCFEVDPTIQFFQDTWPTKAGQLKRWQGVTNVTWCPDSGTFNLAPWHWIRSEKRPMWEYFCYQFQRGFEPHSLYRGAGPRAWNRQLQGTAFFATGAYTGSPWSDLDGPFGDTCVVLSGVGGKPVNTRRWEAWREGIEDYTYLYLLDRRLRETEGPGSQMGRELIAAFCDLYERQTDHSYLGQQRRGWSVSAEVAQQTEQIRRRIAALLSPQK